MPGLSLVISQAAVLFRPFNNVLRAIDVSVRAVDNEIVCLMSNALPDRIVLQIELDLAASFFNAFEALNILPFSKQIHYGRGPCHQRKSATSGLFKHPHVWTRPAHTV